MKKWFYLNTNTSMSHTEKLYTDYRRLLDPFISLKSVSTDSIFKPEMKKTADWLRGQFEENGFDVQVIEWYGNPIVIAQYKVSDDAETCLIYGHYDVQPAETSDGWTADPFVVREDEKKLYARGIVDNKWQTLIHMVTAFDLIQQNKLKDNLTFMMEGDEETWSPDMEKFVKDHTDLLACDFVMISDGEWVWNHPIIDAGFRWGFNMTVSLSTAKSDCHSWIYGGIAPSSSLEASKLIAQLYDSNNRITIPGRYDDVDEVSEEIRKNNESIPTSETEIKKMNWFSSLVKNPDLDINTCIWLQPTLQVSWISSWYTGEWYKNIVPAWAKIKINGRIVASQDAVKQVTMLSDWIKKTLPDYVSVSIEISDPYPASRLDITHDRVKNAQELMTRAFGQTCFFKYCGGWIPIVSMFTEYLWVICIMASLGNEDCRMHGIDENADIERIKKWLVFSEMFLAQ